MCAAKDLDNWDSIYYDELLDFYETYCNSSEQSLEQKKQDKESFLLNFMNKVIATKDSALITNVSIISLALFEDKPFDLYTNRGTVVSTLDEKHKKLALSVLRTEIIS